MGSDVALVSLLLEAVKQNWHYGFMVAGVILLVAAVRSKKGITIALGGSGGGNGNGNGHHHVAHHGYVSNKRYEEGQAHLEKRLTDHDEDTKELRAEIKELREDVKGQSRVLARIEGKLDGK